MAKICNSGRRMFGKGREVVTNGVIVIVLLFALVTLSRYDGSFSGDVEMESLQKRGVDEPDAGSGSLNTDPPQPWDYSNFTHNPCYMEGEDDIYCGPAFYVIGVQHAGFNLLQRAIGCHTKIDCFNTGFWRNFDNMEDITPNDIRRYIHKFRFSAWKIKEGLPELCICDSGPDLARPYGLNISGGITYPPSFTTVDALRNLYDGIKIIVIVRDPVQRFIREYCARPIYEDFEDYVNQSIADYIECENNMTRDDLSCAYDETLSPLLQAGLYQTLLYRDLNQTISPENYMIVTWKSIENETLRRDTMDDIFEFLGKELPPPFVYNKIDNLFDFNDGCNNVTITSEARDLLREFYSSRNETLEYLGID